MVFKHVCLALTCIVRELDASMQLAGKSQSVQVNNETSLPVENFDHDQFEKLERLSVSYRRKLQSFERWES